MKKSSKAIAVLLAAIMTFACLSVAGFAAPRRNCIPSIVVPGVFQSEVFYYENGEIALNEDGEPLEKPFFLDSTLEIVGKALVEALYPIGSLLVTQEDKDEMAANAVADVLGEVLMEKQRCDENGKFIYDVRATKYEIDGVAASFAELSEHDQEYILNELPLQNYIDIAGEENLYVFSYASFGNMIDTATELYNYIKSVKEHTGADKVNIVPISQGGSVANALMQIYADKGESMADDIYKLVFIVPALDGSLLLGEIYEYGLIDDDDELYLNMFPALIGDDDWTSYLINTVLRILPNADVNNIIDKAVDVLIEDYIAYSTLMWGLVPSGNYPGAAAKYLEGDSFTEIKKQTDWFYQSQLNSDANILKAIDDGVQVFDIVDYNCYLYEIVDSWDDVNADGIIQLDSTSMGAYSAGVDKLLPDDYEPACNNCTDPEHHDHEDPNYIVDACCGLLPETTFYFYGQNHERTASNDIIMKLAAELLTDDNFVDVFSYPDKFPQFNVGRNSKGLMRDLERMKDYDFTGVPQDVIDDYKVAEANAYAALANTNNTNPAEFEEAKAAFDAACYLVKTKGVVPEQEDEGFDFEALLLKILKFVSDLLFRLFGGQGFSQMVNDKIINL